MDTSDVSEMVCSRSQFDIPHGSLSCMATSMCCARLFLEQPLECADLERILEAGAKVYHQWSQENNTEEMQCWTDVVKAFPPYLKNIRTVYEGNGFFGDTKNSEYTVLYKSIFDPDRTTQSTISLAPCAPPCSPSRRRSRT